MANNFWRGRKVLVTGATGMLGSWLAKKLVESRADVTILLRDMVKDSELYMSGTIKKVNVARSRKDWKS